MSSNHTNGSALSRRSLAVAIGMALTAGSAQAGTIAVTTTDDSGSGSFREAIQTANGNAGPDTIEFSAVSGQTITLASNLPVIDDDLTLQGSDVTLDGDSQFSCLGAIDANLAVNDMTVTACTGTVQQAPELQGTTTVDSYGGGIYVDGGNLAVTGSTISGNAARPDSGSYTYSLIGGGIYVKYGSLTVTDSVIAGNEANIAGGILHFGIGSAGNQPNGEAPPGALSISGSTISGNTAEDIGGGMLAYNLYSAATIEQSEIIDNQAGNAGGGLMFQADGSQFSLANSTISGNSASGGGGGAVILNKYPGSTELFNNTISNNTGNYIAGLYLGFQQSEQPPPPKNESPAGTGPSVALYGQTITGNTASSGAGGGLTAAFGQPTTVLVANSIIAGNSAATGSGDLSATSPNLRMRARSERLPEQYRSRGGQMPTPENTTFDVDFSIIGETPTDGSVFDADSVSTGLVGEDPQLGTLADNGGPTQTHLPADSSPALDIVTAGGGCGAFFDTDQRGEPRPETGGTLCDAGSVELGAQPVIDVNPDVAFGNVTVGNSAGPEAVTLANTGTGALEVSGFSGLSAPFTVDFSDCGASLPFSVAAGASCDLQAEFAPTNAGNFTQLVTVDSNTSDGGDETFELSGAGIEPGIDAAPLDFGGLAVGDSAQDTVTVSNTGQGDLSISNLSLSDDAGGVFGLVGDNCGSPIASGNSCDVTISFAPATAASFTGSLAVSSNATAEPVEVALTGQGLIGELVISPAGGLDFGDVPVGDSGQSDLTLSNNGDAPVEVNGWPDPTDPFSIVGGSCPTPPFTLDPGESCTLTFGFSPSEPGDYDAALEFTVDDGTGSSAVPVSVAGSGTQPQPTAVSVPTLNHIGLVIGGGLLALMGLLGLRRRQDGGSV